MKKAKLSPWKCALKEMQVLATQEFMSREIFPQGPMRGKGKGGDSEVPDPGSREKKAEAGDRKTLIHAPCA